MLGIWTRGSSPNSEGSRALHSPFRFSGGESVTGFVANGAQQTWEMYVIVYACTARGCMCQWCLASPREKHTPSSRLLRDVNGYVGKSHTSRSSRKHYQAENWSLRCGAEGRWWCRTLLEAWKQILWILRWHCSLVYHRGHSCPKPWRKTPAKLCRASDLWILVHWMLSQSV